MGMGKVTVWYMTEEERLAYIEKHPIIKHDKPSGSNFAMTEDEFVNRSKKARSSRWGNRDRSNK